MFFKHFASKNQPPGLSINGTLVENGLKKNWNIFLEKNMVDVSLHEKLSFPLRISSVNMTKFAGKCGFGQIYWKNL